MPAIPIRREDGAKSYPAVETIVGGQLVEGRTAGAGVAAAGSSKVLGVARNDALATLVTDPVNGVLNTAPLGTRVGVNHGCEAPVTYAAVANLGDKLIAAAAGAVIPAGANPDARTIVGECTQPGGVTVAGSVALAWIY